MMVRSSGMKDRDTKKERGKDLKRGRSKAFAERISSPAIRGVIYGSMGRAE
jgi:hypothetical protein